MKRQLTNLLTGTIIVGILTGMTWAAKQTLPSERGPVVMKKNSKLECEPAGCIAYFSDGRRCYMKNSVKFNGGIWCASVVPYYPEEVK